MEAHEIIAATKGKKEAKAWSELTGQSPQLFDSYGYEPRNSENPQASGNYSPLTHYMTFFARRKAINPAGAVEMQRLLNEWCGESLADSPKTESLGEMSMQILDRATEAVKGMNGANVELASLDALRSLDAQLAALDSEVAMSRSFVRAELKRRACVDNNVSTARLASDTHNISGD